MPPKPKYSADEIASEVLRLIKTDGLAALTARELGARLGTSSRPLFTAYANMDELKQAARVKALQEFKEYVGDYRAYTPSLKRIGTALVTYAIDQPEMFKLIFMQQHRDRNGLVCSLYDMGDMADVCIGLARSDYGLNEDDARFLTEQLWISAFGMGTMCVLDVCRLSEEEISRRLSAVFLGTVSLIRSGKANIVCPVEKKAGAPAPLPFD